MADAPSLCASDQPEREAALAVAERIEASLQRDGRARLAVPGGSALAVLPHLRAELGRAWRRVWLTWADERCVPFASDDSNRGAAYRSGALDERDATERELPLYLDGETPEHAQRRVEAALAGEFEGGLDALLLGLGEDGHVASLFPGAPPLDGRIAFVLDSPKPPAARMTLTRSFLATAPHAVVFARGAAKRDAVRRVLARDPALPTSALPSLLVVSDLEIQTG